MKSVRLQPPPLPPLLRPMRLSVPVPDLSVESDSPPVSSDDESDYFLSNVDENNTPDEEEGGYDSDITSYKPNCENKEVEQLNEGEYEFEYQRKEDLNEDEYEFEYQRKEDPNAELSKYFNHLKAQNKEAYVTYHCWDNFDLELEFDKPVWESYYRQVDQSKKGFDIKDYSGPRPLPNFLPIPCYLHQRKKRRMLKGYAERALEKYNDDKGTNHVIEKVLNVKRGACRDDVYYLVFSAKTGNGEKVYFHAIAVKDQDDKLDFPVVRPRVKRATDWY